MLQPWLISLTIIMFSGCLSIVRADFQQGYITENLEKTGQVSEYTSNFLWAATLLFERSRDFSSLPEFLTKNTKFFEYRVNNFGTLQKIETQGVKPFENKQNDSEEVEESDFKYREDFLIDLGVTLSIVDTNSQPFIKGPIKIHITPDEREHLKWESRATMKVEKGLFCVINIKLLTDSHPFIIDPNHLGKLLDPDEDGNIILGPETKVFLSCGQGSFEYFNRQFMIWQCFGNNIFHYNRLHMNFRDIICKSKPEPTFIDYSVGEDIVEREEVFFVDDKKNHLWHQSYILNAKNLNQVYYIKTTLSKYIKGGQIMEGNKRMNDEKVNDEVQRNIFKNYNNNEQDISFPQQFQGAINDYCLKSNPMMKSQLVKPSSIIYETLALRSFYYLNYFPQWKSIMSNNWKTINNHVNKMANYFNADMFVITGVYEEFQINSRDISDTKPLFLKYRLDRKTLVKEIPVPLYFYKIVINSDNREGIVFITVNNPYLTSYPLYELCDEPFFPKLKKNNGCLWNPKLGYHGYSYACSIDDFFEKSRYPIRDNLFNHLKIEGLLPTEIEYDIDNSE